MSSVSVAVGHLDRLLCAVIGKIPSLQHALLRPRKRNRDGHLAVKAVNFRSVCRQAHIEHHTLLSRADDCSLIVAQCVTGADMQLNVSAVRRLDDRLHRRLVQRDRRVRRLDRQRLRFQIKDVVHGADGQRHFFRFQIGHVDLRRAAGFELLFTTGSAFDTRAEAYAVAEAIPDGRTSQFLLKKAREHGVYITGSFVERDGADLYNTAVLAGPDGLVGKFRKLHPCEDEVYWAEPGNLGIPVFHTPIGRIALLICLDAYYPECFRICALQGADIICTMFNACHVKESRRLPDPYATMAGVLCMANALSNHVFVACCDAVGECNGTRFAGQSMVADQWGAPLAGPASDEEEAIVYADIDLADSRRKYFHPTNSRLANRRIDVYSQDLGYHPEKYH